MKWNTGKGVVQVEFGKWPGEVGICTDQGGQAVTPGQVCMTETERFGILMEEDRERRVTTEEVAEWVALAEVKEEFQEAKHGNVPQTREFLEEEECMSVLVNPENECETGGDWIEDCPTPTVSVLLRRGSIEKKIEAILDSGSDVNVLSWEVAVAFQATWTTLERVGEVPWSITTANGSKTQIEWCVDLVLEMGTTIARGVRFYVVKGVPAEVIIGNTTMERWGW